MSDRSLTLLAIHFDDTELQIGPKRIGTQSAEDSETTENSPDSPAPSGSTEGGKGASPLAILVAAVLSLLAIAAILGRVRSRSTAVDSSGDTEHE